MSSSTGLGTELDHLAYVVASEVDKHDVLGPLLGVLGQLRSQAAVVRLGTAPPAVPAIGREITRPSRNLHHRLGRGADDGQLGVLQEVHVGARVDLAQ